MSLYYLQKFLYDLNRDPDTQAAFRDDAASVLENYDLSDEELAAVNDGNIGLLYVLGVNGQILMHYAAFLSIEWFDYLDQMRNGIQEYGPVRAGVYTMTGAGESFTVEGQERDEEGQA